MQAPGPNPVDPQTKLKSYKIKEKNIKGRDKGFFFFFLQATLCSVTAGKRGWEGQQHTVFSHFLPICAHNVTPLLKSVHIDVIKIE